MGYTIRTNDGIVIQGIPDDIPPDHVSIKQRVNRVRAEQKTSEWDAKVKESLTGEMGGLQKFNAGMGKAFTDIGQGAAQLFGGGPSGEEVKEQRRLDAPLMKTGAGTAGNVAGNVAALAPLAVIPGANTVAGAGVLGALSGAVQPTAWTGERLTNMAAGGAIGAGTQALAGPVATKVGEWGARKEAESAARQSQNTVRDQTLADGQKLGLVVPPSAVNQPGFIGGRAESLAGKAATNQEASLRNQQGVNAVARREAGLGPEEAISIPNLKAARQRLSEPYREVAALNQQAAADLEAMKAAKLESKLQWTSYQKSGDPAAYKAAQKSDAEANRLLTNIENAAQNAGKPELVAQLKKARVDIAKNHQIRDATNVGSGDVEAAVLGRALDRGAPLSGDMKTIAQYQQAFPRYMTEGSKVPSPGVGKTELLAAALLSGGGMGATDSPYGAAAGLLPLLSGPTRSVLLSKALQESIAKPNYGPGATASAAAALKDPETQRRVAMLARALSLPAIPQAVAE